MPDISMGTMKDRIKIDRKAWSQQDIEDQFNYTPRKSPSLVTRLRKECKFSADRVGDALISCVPIIGWLPKYERSFLVGDVLAGLTVGIFLVPQGMAYATLAGLAPVYGLYSSFFPSLLHMVFGTSRHVSHGVFAVVSIMTHSALLRILPHSDGNGNSVINSTGTNVTNDLTPIEVVSALTLAVGLVQILMVVLRLSFITAYLSDQVIAGFTTGSACHVIASQLNKVIGVPITNHTGPFNLYYTLREIILKVPSTNIPTLITFIISVAFLFIGKEYVNPLVQKRISVPIPLELIAVVVSTALSYFLKFEGKYRMHVVSHIPTGLPIPTLPRFELMPRLIGDAVSIAVVTFVVTASLCKLFAKKHGYRVNQSQELRALAISQCIISTLSCHPASGNLSRSLLNAQMGVKTHLSQIFCASLLLVVILWIGPLLEPLPMCILASIIIVALKGMIMQLTQLKALWPVSKIDFFIWLVSFLATVCWDVTEGLIIAIAFALLTVIFRLQWPKSMELGRLSHSDLYKDATRFGSITLSDSVRVFRFDAPLLFANVEAFKESAHKLVAQSTTDQPSKVVRAIVIDCSVFSCIDCMGVVALKELSQEMAARDVCIYLASCNAVIRDLFQSLGFDKNILRFYPSIHDAMHCALSDCSLEGKVHDDDPVYIIDLHSQTAT